jgi:aquaporin NIP
MNMNATVKTYLGELIGTFILLFCGAGAIVVHQETGGAVTHVGICIVWGLVVMALIYTLGEVSGCHINPAVTVALALVGLFPWQSVAPYIVAQVVGAFLAVYALHVMFPGNEGLGGTYPKDDNALQSWVMELFLTFFLMLTILFTTQGKRDTVVLAAFAIGAVVALEALFAGPISGASMNPARSLAPALLSGKVGHVWVYLTASPIGAALGAGIWKVLK